MKKIFNKLIQRLALWRLLGRNKVLYRFDEKHLSLKGNNASGFRVTIKRYYMDIVSVSESFRMRLPIGTRPYGYLLASAQQNRIDQIYGFCVTIYSVTMLCTAEQELNNDIHKAINNYILRTQTKAENQPKASDFEHNIALREVKANVERGQMTRQQRRKAERDARKKMKEGLRELEAEELEKEKQ